MIALLNCVNNKKNKLSVILDKHVNFHEHIKRRIKIYNQLVRTIKHLSVHLPRNLCKRSISFLFNHTLIMII